jgi:SSS family solute:Na+ symporter
MLIGSLLWSFYRLTGEIIPKSITKADGIFPHFLVTHIPSGLAGLFVAALLGSAMSMLASDMNCLSVIAVEDFYRFARPRSTDRQLLRAGRIVVAASGLAAAAVALRLAHTQGSALSLYYTITAVVAGGLAGLFLLAFLMPRATREGAIAGLIVSLIFTAWATFTEGGKILNLGHWNFTWHDYMIGAIGHVILLAVGIAASLLLPGSPLAPDLTWQGWRRQSQQQVPAGV